MKRRAEKGRRRPLAVGRQAPITCTLNTETWTVRRATRQLVHEEPGQ